MVYMHMQGSDEARQAASVKVLHDARAVHDMATLDLSGLVQHGTAQWVVARIVPASQSGFATIPGANIRADTGQFVNPGNASPVLMKQGHWEVLASSGVQEPPSGTYSWTEPLATAKRHLTPEDYYSPFVKGGIVIRGSALNKGLSGNQPPVYLTFDNWVQDVPDAIAHAVTPQPTSNLLGTPNPLLQVQAFRRLLQSGALQPSQLADAVARASEDVAAVDTYLALVHKRDAGEQLAKLVGASNSDDTCRGIVIGAYAVKLLANNPAAASQATSVLAAARNKLAGPLERDEYLKALFGN